MKKEGIEMKKLLILLLILANLSFGEEKISKTSKAIEKIIEQVEKDYERGNPQKAISTLKKKILENPTDVKLKFVLGLIYFDMNRKDEGNKEFNEVVELQKKYPFIDDDGKIYDIRFLIGSYFMSVEDYENSLKWFTQMDKKELEKCFDNEPGFSDYILGALSFAAENYKEAKEYLLKSYVYDEDGLSENILGQIYLNEGNQKEARKWFLESANKGNSGAQANLGVIYYQLEDKDMALKWLKKAFETAKKEKDDEKMKDIQEIIKEAESSN